VRVDHCSAVRALGVPVLVCLRSSCSRMTEVRGRKVCETRAECYRSKWRRLRGCNPAIRHHSIRFHVFWDVTPYRQLNRNRRFQRHRDSSRRRSTWYNISEDLNISAASLWGPDISHAGPYLLIVSLYLGGVCRSTTWHQREDQLSPSRTPFSPPALHFQDGRSGGESPR